MSDRFTPPGGRTTPPRRRRRAALPRARSQATTSRDARSALDDALAAALAAPAPAVTSFAELGVPPRLVEALRRLGLELPFPIQARALPDALAGRDVLGRASTGSGKTLAFGLPVLARLAGPDDAGSDAASDAGRAVSAAGSGRLAGAPRALVLVPSRELAQQVTATLSPLAEAVGLRVAAVVGGASYGPQTQALARGVDLLVATPGRLVDLIERGACRLDRVAIVTLDEADYMADLGFLPVVTRLLRMTPSGGQRLLFSATLDRGVAGLVETFLDQPAVHAVATATAAVDTMTHRLFVVDREQKVEVAAEVAARPARTLFFVRTKHGAARLAKRLGQAGVDATALHGNLSQNARERAMAAFTAGRTRVLVATDVAARGLHVDDVDLVVHFDPPADHKTYLHRSGRTARAGSTGTVVSFVQSEQLDDVRQVHRDASVRVVAETVAPGHAAVREIAASGEPVVVRAVPTSGAGPTSSGAGRAPTTRAAGRRPRPRTRRRVAPGE